MPIDLVSRRANRTAAPRTTFHVLVVIIIGLVTLLVLALPPSPPSEPPPPITLFGP